MTCFHIAYSLCHILGALSYIFLSEEIVLCCNTGRHLNRTGLNCQIAIGASQNYNIPGARYINITLT
jgi:hypothetical protein